MSDHGAIEAGARALEDECHRSGPLRALARTEGNEQKLCQELAQVVLDAAYPQQTEGEAMKVERKAEYQTKDGKLRLPPTPHPPEDARWQKVAEWERLVSEWRPVPESAPSDPENAAGDVRHLCQSGRRGASQPVEGGGIDTSGQDAEYEAWTTWHPESVPDKRDAHCHGFDAGVQFVESRLVAAEQRAQQEKAAADVLARSAVVANADKDRLQRELNVAYQRNVAYRQRDDARRGEEGALRNSDCLRRERDQARIQLNLAMRSGEEFDALEARVKELERALRVIAGYESNVFSPSGKAEIARAALSSAER